MSTVREVLDAGGDPAVLVGGFDTLVDIVIFVGTTPVQQRLAVAARERAVHPHWSGSEWPVHVTVYARTQAELLEDPDLFARLLDEHPRGAELEAALGAQMAFNRCRIGTVRDDDAARGFPGDCAACGTILEPGMRAFMLHETRICLACVRPAFDELAGRDDVGGGW